MDDCTNEFPPHFTAEPSSPTPPEMQRFLRVLFRISPEGRKQVYELLEQIAVLDEHSQLKQRGPLSPSLIGSAQDDTDARQKPYKPG